jgi:hypothetical protein
MELSDLKIFVPVIAIAVVGYLLLIPGASTKKWAGAPPPPPKHTITFVPKGTPGAITWEEYQRQKWGNLPRKR